MLRNYLRVSLGLYVSLLISLEFCGAQEPEITPNGVPTTLRAGTSGELTRYVPPPKIELGAEQISIPDYYTKRIETDTTRKYRRLLIQLGSDETLQKELVLNPDQTKPLATAFAAFNQLDKRLEKIRVEKLAEFESDQENDELRLGLEGFAWERKKLLDEAFEGYLKVVEENLVAHQIQELRLKATGFALDKNLPETLPKFVLAYLFAKNLPLSEDERKHLHSEVSKAAQKFKEAAKKAETTAIKVMVESYPEEFQEQLRDLFGVDNEDMP